MRDSAGGGSVRGSSPGARQRDKPHQTVGVSVTLSHRRKSEARFQRGWNRGMVVQPVVDDISRYQRRNHYSRDARAILFESKAVLIIGTSGDQSPGGMAAGGGR